jgi:MOSC domain-containing protein YiiM
MFGSNYWSNTSPGKRTETRAALSASTHARTAYRGREDLSSDAGWRALAQYSKSVMTSASVVSIHIGRVAPLGPDGVPSAFVKQAVSGPIAIARLGLIGDEQADLTVHGGEEKAVYGYGFANYAAWRAELPKHRDMLTPGGFGENLAVDGMIEADICVGDVHGIGTSRLQVCQPRQPCFKFALRFDDKFMPKAMVRNGRSGWYYRVVEPGVVSAGDPVRLLDRPNAEFPFPRLVEIINHGNATLDELKAMRDMPGLASNWQYRARELLNRSIQATK